jgi:hypothetical protein
MDLPPVPSPAVKSLGMPISWIRNYSSCYLPSLDHELLDDTVESGALVTEALLAGSQSTSIVSIC